MENTSLFIICIILICLSFIAILIIQNKGNQDKDSELPIFYQPRILFTVGGILGTSIIMAIIEVVSSRFVLLPRTHSQIINQLRKKGKDLESERNNTFTDIDNEFGLTGFLPPGFVFDQLGQQEALMYSLAAVEEKKVKTVNRYAYLSVLIPLLIISFLIFLIINRLRLTGKKYGITDVFSFVHVRALFYGILLSVFIFGAFQYVFYLFGIDYSYASNQQVQVRLAEEIRKQLNCDSSNATNDNTSLQP
ncbi:MAG: hypothetical protein GY932_07180 [Arcobacter sp.]|nr:hypothetical protein [Flavobacteriaceae bacterium]MCP4970357.1 hypothetical protein [Arcobacter sp.]